MTMCYRLGAEGMPCCLQIVHYVPKFYFGSLLMMFGVEILRDWLLFSFRKVHKKEYILLWLTFLAIMIGTLPAGLPPTR